ncbi:acetyl-CoA carboxylase biotin carboxyl carrier protein [Spirillospora sp. CA-255316]
MPVSNAAKSERNSERNSEGPARGRRPQNNDPHAALDGMCRNVLALIEALPGPPRRIALHLDPPGVEIEWPAEDARSAQATGEPRPTGEARAASHDAPASQDGPGHREAAGPRDGAGAHAEVEVKAANVGTFYRRPEPSAAPFVEVGDHVEEGRQIAIVEAMKLMIPVEAPVAGTVTAVLAEDGTAVEYGQPLLSIRPAA